MLATGTIDARRSYAYLPSCDHSQAWDGVLTLTADTGVRTPRTVTDRYGVEEQPADGFPGRVFLICKEAHAGDLDTAAGRKALERCGEVYEVRIPVAASPSFCTCLGHRSAGRCKHIEGLLMLLVDGVEIGDPVQAQPRPVPMVRRRSVAQEVCF